MIRVEGLHFRYPGGPEEAIKGLEFEVEKGEVFGFLGPSGAGKSTAQKIITGVLQGWRGSVRVFGEALSSLGREYYEKIGVSFEFPNVYSKLTGMENLAFFRSLYSGETAEPKELLSLVGLADAADARVAGYSKGMKMRLNFCRALLGRPEILFLDEPTSGQDPANARLIRDIIRTQRKAGRTVFLTTHNMTVAQELCDRVAFIVDGSIRTIDSPRELTIKHGRRAVRVEYRSDGEARSADFDLAGLGTNREFLDLVREGDVETIHSLEATLEDVFLQVTGRRLA